MLLRYDHSHSKTIQQHERYVDGRLNYDSSPVVCGSSLERLLIDQLDVLGHRFVRRRRRLERDRDLARMVHLGCHRVQLRSVIRRGRCERLARASSNDRSALRRS
jgi:hypothetical protein